MTLAGSRLAPLLAVYRHIVRWRWVYALLLSAVIFYFSSIPIRLPRRIPYLDKMIHVAVYLGLALTYFNVLTIGGTRRSRGRYLAAFALAVAFGASDEWHQSYVPGRRADWQDLVADTIGAGLGTWAGWGLARRWAPQVAAPDRASGEA